MKRLLIVLLTCFLLVGCGDTPEPTVAPTPTATVANPDEEVVYITPSGECFHSHECGNGTYNETTRGEAVRKGYRPCKRCYE